MGLLILWHSAFCEPHASINTGYQLIYHLSHFFVAFGLNGAIYGRSCEQMKSSSQVTTVGKSAKPPGLNSRLSSRLSFLNSSVITLPIVLVSRVIVRCQRVKPLRWLAMRVMTRVSKLWLSRLMGRLNDLTVRPTISHGHWIEAKASNR